MPKNISAPETFKGSLEGLASCRELLATLAGAGIFAVLPGEAHAVTKTQKRVFVATVRAINDLASYYHNQADSPLWKLLDPNVEVYNLHTKTQKRTQYKGRHELFLWPYC